MYTQTSDLIRIIAKETLAKTMSPTEALKILTNLEKNPALQKEVADALSRKTAGAMSRAVSEAVLAISLLLGSSLAGTKQQEIINMLNDQAFKKSELNINEENIKKQGQLEKEIEIGLAGVPGKSTGMGKTESIGKREFLVDTKKKADVMKKIQDLLALLKKRKSNNEITQAQYDEKVEKLSQAFRDFSRGR